MPDAKHIGSVMALDWGLKGCLFVTHQSHCVVFLSKTHLSLVYYWFKTETLLNMTEKFLTGP